MIQLPPLQVNQGQPFETVIEWTVDGETPDTSDWSGAITVKTAPKGDAVGTWAVDLSVNGQVRVSLTAEDTATFPALARLGRFVTAVFQIDLTDPDGAGQVFQGSIAVSGAV
jgi:hypothetical protein